MYQKNGRYSKVRWHCGLCGVSCKDANGFKCHLESDTHLRKEDVVEHERVTTKYHINDFSRKFAKSFVDTLAAKFPGQYVLAHDVYDVCCANDRGHKIMKETCWETLGRFVAYMRNKDQFEAEKTESGWRICMFPDQYPPKNEDEAEGAIAPALFLPSDLAAPPSSWNNVKKTKAAEPKQPRAKKLKEEVAVVAPTLTEPEVDHTLVRGEGDAPIAFSMKAAPKKPTVALVCADSNALLAHGERACDSARAAGEGGEELLWPRAGMCVKVVNTQLSSWHKRKAVVKLVRARSREVEVSAVDSSDRLVTAVDKLETVIPCLGGRVQVCQGAHNRKFGVLKSVDVDNFCGTVVLDSTKEEVSLPYESFCKVVG